MRLLRVCLVLAVASTAVSVLQAQTAGTVPKFTGSGSETTDSVITESSGYIGVGISTPATPFHVSKGTGVNEIATFQHGSGGNGYITVGTGSNAGAYLRYRPSENVAELGHHAAGTGVFVDSQGRVGIGTTTLTSFVTIAPSAPPSGTSSAHNFLNLTGTLNSVNTSPAVGARFDITTAGNTGQQRALQANLLAGYSGTGQTAAGMFLNTVAALGTRWQPGGTGGSNLGALQVAFGTTTGSNVGAYSNASGSQTFNAGTISAAVDPANSAARNVGLVSFARNASTANVAAYFSLGAEVVIVDASAALVADNGTEAAPIFVGRDNGTEVMRVADDGNVGIGTAAPSYKIDVQGGQINASGGLCIAGTCKTSWAEASPWTTSSGNIGFTSGDVGIGTASPAAKLQVAGGHVLLDDTRFLLWGPAGQTGISGNDAADSLSFFTNNTEKIRITATGDVGIGTTSPANTKFEVLGSVLSNLFGSNDRRIARFNECCTGANGTDGDLQILTTNSPGNNSILLHSGYGANSGIAFGTRDASTAAGIRMVVTGAGNVGIGTVTPDAANKLHVAGNIKVDGNINAKYQDVAEWVESDERLEAGTVVIADPDSDNRVQTAATPYDTAVAGVVSAQPGVLLGEAGEGKVAVAQSGRVLVKVDASFGVIKRGDLLVASSTPGHAMRSEAIELGGITMHRPGTIIGKALGALDSGQGQILVLLTLQ